MKIPVKAVLSDAGGIIFDDTGCGKVVYEQVARYAHSSSREIRRRFSGYRHRVYTDPDYSYAAAWDEFCRELGLGQQAAEHIKALHYDLRQKVTIKEGVKETIRELREQGIDFILLTDSGDHSSETKRWLGQNYAVSEYTDIISSKDLGVMKPDSRFFEEALVRFGLRKEDTVFVAHDYDELRGAHDLGYRVLALNYKKDEDLGFIPEELKLKSFSDILEKVSPKNGVTAK